MAAIDMDRVRAALREAIARPGQSSRGLSLRAGLGPDAVRDILGGKSNNARIDTLSALAKALGSDLSMFSSTPLASEPSAINVGEWPKDVPVYGTVLGGDLVLHEDGKTLRLEQTIVETGEVVDMVRRPPMLAGNRRLYALYVSGTSMEPRYEPGEVIFVDPRRPPSIGDYVVVQLRQTGDTVDGHDNVPCSLIKRLVRRNASSIILEQFNPAQQFTVPMERVAAVHRVLSIGDFTGA